MAEQALVSTRKGLFVFRRKNGDWSVTANHFGGTPLTLAFHDPNSGAVYAALRHGHFGPKLHRSDDQGANWIELAAPAFPEALDGKPTLKQIWALEASKDGVLWAGGIPAGLFRSDDKGASWQLVDALWQVPTRSKWFGGGYDEAGIHSIVCDPRDAAHIIVAISCGGVWETRDGGASWSARTKGMIAPYVPPEQSEDPDVQDPHRMVSCASDPDVLWVQHHGGVFHSGNGGAQWQELHPPVSNFGFAVAVHPSRADIAWLAPAHSDQLREPVDGRVVVNRTSDGGRSFETFSRGLPDQAYDLVYRHGLAVDETGQHLVMGSTTGGLWFSGDGGEGWTMAKVRLPPIYAVTFA